MSSAVNYGDVVNQLQTAGLDTSGFDVGTSRPLRCFVDGERGRKGWYWLHEMPFDSGDVFIVGSFGVWHGNDNGLQKIKIPKAAKASKEDNALVRKRIMENKKRLQYQLKEEQAKAACEALRKWRDLSDFGESGYLIRKQIVAKGVRFTRDGAIAVPMCDTSGKLHGLQFILDKDNPVHREKVRRLNGSDKRFWPNGLAMQGHFHMIDIPDPNGVILITEGYATGVSLHEATGLAVAVVFSVNNMIPVILNLEKQYPKAYFLIAADDDYLCRCPYCKKQTRVENELCFHCTERHGKQNTGVTVAMKATMSVDSAEWIKPEFVAREGQKLTDFNDLHIEEGLLGVADQLKAAIDLKFPHAGKAKPPTREIRKRVIEKALLPFINVDEACDRYSLVYGVKDLMFDHQERCLVPKSCVMDIMPDHGWKEWKTRPDRKIVKLEQVGFDPTDTDDGIVCNLWNGWPTVPNEKDSCEKLLELLAYMCSGEERPDEVYRWVLRWLAYPIQNPGAKMRTAIVFHGPQGAGKNIFFEAVKAIYGKYGFIIGQDALEDTFTDWLSAKLYLIANEVVARQELFHTKNRIKGLITEDTIRIRAPYVKSMWEKNHANLVFLSNEKQPLVLEKDDRRFMVVWTPDPKPSQFYIDASIEVKSGGIEALHNYLLKLDLGDFSEHTKPLKTRAKSELIELSKESPDRFIEVWLRDEISVACQTCALADLYRLYEKWCRSEGERSAYTKLKFSSRIRMCDGIEVMKKPVMTTGKKPKTVTVVVPKSDQKPEGYLWVSWLVDKIREFNKEVEGTDSL